MAKKKKLKVGGKLIEDGKVYRIFKIKRIEINGGYERIIYYKPYYSNPFNRSLTCSVPEDNLVESNIRTPTSRKKIKGIIERLSRKNKRLVASDLDEVKDILKLNDIRKTAKILNKYWNEIKDCRDNFTKRQRDIVDMAKEGIVEQVALSYHVSLSSAEKKLVSALEK